MRLLGRWTLQSLRSRSAFIEQRSTIPLPSYQQQRFYAKGSTTGIPSLGKALGKKGKLGKSGPVLEKKVLEVEKDPVRLVTYVCGSSLAKTGGQDIQLQEDSLYPEWLWKLNTGKPLPLDDLDPDTEYYWKRVKRIAMTRSLQLQKLKKF